MPKKAAGFDAKALADRIERELRGKSTRRRAVQEKAYLKSELTHLGATLPVIRKTVSRLLREHAELSRLELIELARVLWQKPVHERRAVAAMLLEKRQKLLTAEDLPLIERLIREAKTWALVDVLAPAVAGPIVEREPRAASVLDRWAQDADFWVRRASMLALLGPLRRGEGDFQRFGRYADAMMEESEFFVRKAIGWVLREVARKRPALTIAFMRKQAHRASGVTLREAIRNLPTKEARAILKLAKAKIGLPARRRYGPKPKK